MSLLWLVAVACAVALPISLTLGTRWRHQLLLALSGVALVAALIVLALARGCPPNAYECSPALTLFYGGFLGGLVVLGWLMGIGTGCGISYVARRRRR